MNQLENISLQSAQEAAARALERQKPEPRYKLEMRLCKDGKRRPKMILQKTSPEHDWHRLLGYLRESDGGCWEWVGAKSKEGGYGCAWIRGKREKSHRLAYELCVGKIPDGMLVCHKCDNPPCSNPSHLFLGTNLDNSKDCTNKGRNRRERGEDRYNAKLSGSEIAMIRMRYRFRGGKDSGCSLAKEFGVAKTMISAIVKNKKWRHITPSHPSWAVAQGLMAGKGEWLKAD